MSFANDEHEWKYTKIVIKKAKERLRNHEKEEKIQFHFIVHPFLDKILSIYKLV